VQAIRDAGFDLVMEQFDALGADIAQEMTKGSYRTSGRSTFIGIKTSFQSDPSAFKSTAAPGLRQE
jgi:hypothetical protein